MVSSNGETANSLVNTQTPVWNVNADVTSSDGTLSSDDPHKGKIKRETWSRKIDFLFACVGFSVGLGNVWRFPFLCYRNGGGAFLIPYFIAVFLGGIPVFFLEVSLGQFMSEGGIGPWKICPLFQGVGYTSAVIVFLLNCDYNVILAWTFYYLFASFTSVLPWSNCDNEWNTPNCTTFRKSLNTTLANSTSVVMGNQSVTDAVYNLTSALSKVSLAALTSNETAKEQVLPDPVTEFWERKVLQLSSDVGEPGTIKWDLALCLLLAWIVVYFCIWKGIKSSGKVMYFTATTPYILLIVLLIRGCTLDGAMDGIHYYLVTDWGRLLDPQVWADAGTQIFYSYSTSLGTLMALGSYNKFHHNSFRDSIIFALVNSGTSLLSGFVIFSILGFMAKQQNVSVANVAESGPGLAFIAYPEAVSQMPVAPLWSILFFAMIILLGLDSQFVGVEGFVTAVVDMYPAYIRKGRRREILIGVICLLSFLIGLSMVTQGGMYVFQLFDYYSSSRIILVVAFFECVVVAYIYGIRRFYDNLEMMFGFRLNRCLWVCWTVLTPTFTFMIFIMGCISYSELTYNRKTVTYEYPSWAIAIGWTMAASSVIFIPGIMIKRITSVSGSLKERIIKLIRPRLKRHQIRHNEDMSAIDIVEDEYEIHTPYFTDSNDKPCTATQLLSNQLENGETLGQNGQFSDNKV